MHPRHFDRLTLTLSITSSRRAALRAVLSASALGLARGQHVSALTTCSLKANGTRCSDGVECCSGLCKRKKGSHKTFCRQAPGQGTCTIEQDECVSTCNDNVQCHCSVTTNGRSFCGGSEACTACTRDTECTKVTGKGSKCVQCATCSGIDTFCAAPC
jgi:hypothetical protein